MEKPKKYVTVLAHADGWGALAANQLIQHLHERYPNLGIYLIVSRATRNKDGEILNKVDDLKTVRELKETYLADYFDCVDAIYDERAAMAQHFNDHTAPNGEDPFDYAMRKGVEAAQSMQPHLLTFKQLAKRYCVDGEAHFTSTGGPKGGLQAEAFIRGFEKANGGKGPEVLLSVDTMAILPATLIDKDAARKAEEEAAARGEHITVQWYDCFSTHPGPLDDIKVEGMHAPERSLAHAVLYDGQGDPLPRDHVFGTGLAYIKGTLFHQAAVLDKGAPIDVVKVPVMPGMCAYQARDELFHALVNRMIGRLPTFINSGARKDLVARAEAAHEREKLQPHTVVPDLEAAPFATWQGNVTGFANDAMPHGVEVVQNQIVDPHWFKAQMSYFFPGTEAQFEQAYNSVFGNAIERVLAQKHARLEDPWAAYLNGDTDVTIRRHDPKTLEVTKVYHNRGDDDPEGPPAKDDFGR